ncbi:MAG: DUF805 domain-containing protein [Cyanobium sp. 49614_E6]|nr:DUF805 domain-containing protein [Cyanobium sp. 49614_E6]
MTADKLINAFTSAWKRSFDYTGRSDRGDYWFFLLASFIVLLVLNIVGSFVPFIGVLANLYLIAELVPLWLCAACVMPVRTGSGFL